MPCLAFLPCHPSSRALAANLAAELETRGTVTVMLIDGYGLKAADKGGTSDPYALLDLDSRQRRCVRMVGNGEWEEGACVYLGEGGIHSRRQTRGELPTRTRFSTHSHPIHTLPFTPCEFTGPRR